MKIKVCEISGMGGREKGGYEWGCQIICLRAAHFLSKLNGKAPKYKGFKNVTGLVIADEPAAKELDDYILLHPILKEYGMTGAMHEYGVKHGFRLYKMGREAYLAELETARGPEDFFEMEEEEAFPPEAPEI